MVMDPPDWQILTLYGSGFRIDNDAQTWSGVRYRCRGTTGPGDGDGPGGSWPVGNTSDSEMQLLTPAVSVPCAVDIQLLHRLTFEWTDWINCVFAVGSPPLPDPRFISPLEGEGGTLVGATGINLLHTWGLRFDTEAVPALATQTGRVEAPCPEFEITRPLLVPVHVIYPAGIDYDASEIGAGVFQVLPVGGYPHVDNYFPIEGYVEGGSTVHLLGGKLEITQRVEVGARNADLLYVAYDEVIFATPAALNGQPGDATIRLFHELGDEAVGTFHYVSRPPALPPQVNSVLPTAGPATGGTVVAISGTDLEQIERVTFGGLEATDLDRTYGRLICRTPSRGATGPVIVELYFQQAPGRIAAPGLYTFTAAPVAPPEGAQLCRRAAWLTLEDGRVVELEDDTAGYVCAALDIGAAEIREVVDNRPDAHGIDDRTRLMGARVVTAHIVAGGWGTRTMDDIARSFGPFVVPSVRPVLHWITDSPETDYAERTLVLRAAGYTSPIEGASKRDMHLAWTAPDPVVRAAITRSALARPASTAMLGRRYPLTFNRVYPLEGAGAVIGQIVSNGDVDVLPLVRIYGPITAPSFTVTTYPPGAATITQTFSFKPAFRLDAFHYVDVDCEQHTATLDDARRVEASIDWARSTWPVARAGGVLNTFVLNGASTDHTTQAGALWRDGFLAP
jgi:hypothetical protein